MFNIHVEFMHLKAVCLQVSVCLCTDMLYDIIAMIGASDQSGWLRLLLLPFLLLHVSHTVMHIEHHAMTSI